jgi:predicted nucleic acid-binding protein
MKIEQALEGVKTLFLDTAPIIYYIQGNVEYFSLVEPIFEKLSDGDLQAVISPITVMECLHKPCKDKIADLQERFKNILLDEDVIFIITDRAVMLKAIEIRVEYNLKLADAIQVATAISSNCDAFLTGDARLGSIKEIRSIVLNKLEL